MVDRKKDIVIKVSLNDQVYELKTYDGEYPNLMVLLYDQLYLEGFGECKGVGRCGTCHIYVKNPLEKWLVKERNEATTLNKLLEFKDNSRLACQIVIDKSIHEMHVEVTIQCS